MLNLDYETTGQLAFFIFFLSIFILLGSMMYDQKKTTWQKTPKIEESRGYLWVKD